MWSVDLVRKRCAFFYPGSRPAGAASAPQRAPSNPAPQRVAANTTSATDKEVLSLRAENQELGEQVGARD